MTKTYLYWEESILRGMLKRYIVYSIFIFICFVQALDIAANNFSKVSFDMIYVRPEQTLEKWRYELENALKLCQSPVNHISLYSLVLEISYLRLLISVYCFDILNPNTPFGRKVASGKITLPNSEIEADQYHLTSELAESYGMKQYFFLQVSLYIYDSTNHIYININRYEVSNFARGKENECQHSLKGWSGQDYWGIGPGACSRLT